MTNLGRRDVRVCNHRITEWLRLEGISGYYLDELAAQTKVNQSRLLIAVPSLVFSIPKDGDSAISLEDPFQCLTTLTLTNEITLKKKQQPQNKTTKTNIKKTNKKITRKTKETNTTVFSQGSLSQNYFQDFSCLFLKPMKPYCRAALIFMVQY